MVLDVLPARPVAGFAGDPHGDAISLKWDHVEVVLVALAHCVFGGMHNRLLLVCTVSS